MEKDIIQYIQNTFAASLDLIIKNIPITKYHNCYIFFLESIANSDKVTNFILRSLTTIDSKLKIKNIESHLSSPNVVKIKDKQEIEFYLVNGFSIIVTDFSNEILAVETKGELDRSISTPDTQPAIQGPKDAFTENYQKNLGLIKRRIKSKSLAQQELYIGRRTNTKVGIVYINDITDVEMVNDIYQKLVNIDIDGIIDSSYIIQLLTKERNTFPIISMVERPDAVASALLEGKIAIIVDTSPFALILPAFLADFLNPPADNYNSAQNINFIKILRFFCFWLTIMTPALYIALTNYNQESIPTSLILNYSAQRSIIPFPAIVEALIMLIICEILRESDARFPNAYGSAMSLLGGLIIGEAAVRAGLISPVMIIVIAITFLTSLIFTDLEIQSALRYFRLIFLGSAAFLGLYGFILALFYLLIKINSLDTFGKPYFYPISPFDSTYLQKTLFRNVRQKDLKRSSLIAKGDFTKKRPNQ